MRYNMFLTRKKLNLQTMLTAMLAPGRAGLPYTPTTPWRRAPSTEGPINHDVGVKYPRVLAWEFKIGAEVRTPNFRLSFIHAFPVLI